MSAAKVRQFVGSTLSFRSFHRCSVTRNFWEAHRKGKYFKEAKVNQKEVIKEGVKAIPIEVSKFKQEVVEKLKCDRIYGKEHKDYEILWRFDKQETIDSWLVTCDSDHNEGKSTAEMILNQNKKAIFHGTLSCESPKDGVVKASGYCNIMSPTNQLSFRRTVPFEWSHYTHLLMRVRGDGRTYQIVCNMYRDWDIQWNDQYTYMLFTRGGPYWQLAKIPFSKFYLNAKGRIQDKQEAVQLDKILNIGITLGDGNPGPFSLEIDFIGLIHDASHTSEFEYEMYEISPYLIG